jgi:hypothetical protein
MFLECTDESPQKKVSWFVLTVAVVAQNFLPNEIVSCEGGCPILFTLTAEGRFSAGWEIL